MEQVTAKNFNVSGSAENIAQLNLALSDLQSSNTYSSAIAFAYEGVKNITLTDEWVTATYNATTKTIMWNPHMSMVVKNGDVTGVQSPASALGHEFAHGADANFNESTPAQREAYALAVETMGNKELHEPIRSTYDDVLGFVHSNNSTEHTTVYQEQNIWSALGQDGNTYYGPFYSGGMVSFAPVVGYAIDPGYQQVCFGYWDVSYSPSQVDESGHPLPVVTWRGDPVVLNLEGGGVQTQSAASGGVHFDMANNGTPIQTGWATAGEGMLVIDRGQETISSANSLVSSIGALKSLDSNHDGQLTSADSGWATLKVWVDKAGDGKFTSDNLHTLESLGIVALNLATVATDTDDHGNIIKDNGTFVYADGHSGQMASVELVGVPMATTVPQAHV